MQTPAHISFHDIVPTDVMRATIEARVADRIADLEHKFGRLIGCRVSIKGPSAHHRQGGPFRVTLHLSLPGGREVHVDRTPDVDERHGDLNFALGDAFKRAGRQLQDQARRMEGAVKAHQPTPAGHVSRLDRRGGFGFITTGDGLEIYFHKNSVLDGGFDHLTVGSRVTFHEEAGRDGPQASTVKPG
jgi:cold shock CspA family protein